MRFGKFGLRRPAATFHHEPAEISFGSAAPYQVAIACLALSVSHYLPVVSRE